jgi:glycosyltransferase involved in cell wall biosynthesis
MDVSVIIPVYNSEKYLSACIDSVLHQEEVTLEIILVDDGSTDSSGSICDEYANKYEIIRTVHIKNSGQAVAKNEGLKYAKGNYIALTDSDDKMTPQMLHTMVTAGYKHDADIVCCNYKQIDEKGVVSHLDCTGKTYILNHEEALIRFYSRDMIYSQCWTKLYKHQMLKEHHIENEPIRYDEDIIFNIRAFKVAQKTIIIDEPLYEYTYRENSVAHGYWNFKKNINQYIDDRIKRVQITQDAVKDESDVVKKWSLVHIFIYYNELLGRAALYPEYHSDKRIKEILQFIKRHKVILNHYYRLCGFSKMGKILISYLPCTLYMKYRKTKSKL